MSRNSIAATDIAHRHGQTYLHRPPGSTSLANLGSTERPKRAAASPGVAVAHRFALRSLPRGQGQRGFLRE